MIRGKILKISARNHWKSFPIFLAIMTIIVFVIIVSAINDATLGDLLITFLLCVLLFALIGAPAIILHIDYYLRNKETEYQILPDRIIVHKNRSETTYMKSDIEEIYVYVTLSAGHRAISYHYNFARIDMKNGESIYLTSLLNPKKAEDIIKKYFAGIPYYKIDRWFCSTRWKTIQERNEAEKKTKTEIDLLFEDDDREYNSITEFKDTRQQGLPSIKSFRTKN